MTAPQYQLVRSNKRRTISLQVKSGQVRVLAPVYVPQHEIDDLINKKSAWLADKLAMQNELKSKVQERQYISGDNFFYLGNILTLKVICTPRIKDIKTQYSLAEVEKEGTELLVYLPKHNTEISQSDHPVKHLLASWYQQQAQVVLTERFNYLQTKLNLHAKQLTIRHYKTRWGSCDNKKRVKLNWLLIMAPKAVIDYVIIHELCHLVHLNHSADFWLLVNRHTSHHQSAKLWLKTHQQDLTW